MLRRLLLIINKLDGNRRYVPTSELLDYVESNMRLHDNQQGYSHRTIQRDMEAIKSLFGMEIKHKKDEGYYIAERDQFSEEQYEELLANFDILTAINAESGLKRYVLAEHHRPIGSVNLPLFMDAIKNNYCIEFEYTLVRHDDEVVTKVVAPHYLKESQQRWYLLAKEGEKLKIFGIDRISNLKPLEDHTFIRDESIDVDSLFRDSFGIWNQEDIPVENVILSYDALDGKFLKSVPLHHSQTTLVDTDDEFRIKVRLRVTNDFVMELLSRSRSLTVIEPQSLRERIYKIYNEALKRNKI